MSTTITIDLNTLSFEAVGDRFVPTIDIEGARVALIKTPSLVGTKGNRPGGDLAYYTNASLEGLLSREGKDISAGTKVRHGLRSGGLIPAFPIPRGGLKVTHLNRQLITGERLAQMQADRAAIKADWIEKAKTTAAEAKATKVEQQVAAATARPAKSKTPAGGDITSLATAMIGAGKVEEAMALLAKHGLL